MILIGGEPASSLRTTGSAGRYEYLNTPILNRGLASGENAVPRVLLVEPDDDVCLWLWYATVRSGACVTITESIAGAAAALRTDAHICLVIVDAKLPDGRGKVVAAKVARRGVPFLLIHRLADHLRARDVAGRTFEAPADQAIDFVERALRMAMPTTAVSRSAKRRGKRSALTASNDANIGRMPWQRCD